MKGLFMCPRCIPKIENNMTTYQQKESE